jgi:hypothetical protein
MRFSSPLPYAVLAILWLLASYGICFLVSHDTLDAITDEDALVETAGALSFLVASVLFFLCFLKSRGSNNFGLFRTGKNLFFLALALLFFFALGEEISWGQRLFGFQTPAYFDEANRQGELNIHNLEIFHGRKADRTQKTGWQNLLVMNRLFSLFWFSFCCVLPVLCAASKRIRTLVRTINIPIVPLFIGGLVFSNYLLAKLVGIPIVTDRTTHHALVEITEANYAFLFAVLAWWFLRNRKALEADTSV